MSESEFENSTMRRVPLWVPTIQGNEWTYVKECLDTAWVSSVGSFVDRFEQQLAETVGVEHAVATVNGTAALHTALLCCGVQPEDEVLVSTLTFISSVNSIRYVGAHPVLFDAEPNHWQVDPDLIKRFLQRECVQRNGVLVNRNTGRRVRAMMPVHVLGHPVNFDPLAELAEQFDLKVIEDAAEGLGCFYKQRMVGGLGDAGCVSFNGNKMITTGGGGVILTNDGSLAERARYLTTQAKDDPIEYIHNEVGFNYRMTNVLAAIGCGQLEQLPEFVTSKQSQHEFYRDHLEEISGIQVYRVADYAKCTHWMHVVRVDAAQYGLSARELMGELQQRGVQTRPLWQPMHASPAHHACQAVLTGVADELAEECVTLPSSVGLSSADMQYVCDCVKAIGASARRKAA